MAILRLGAEILGEIKVYTFHPSISREQQTIRSISSSETYTMFGKKIPIRHTFTADRYLLTRLKYIINDLPATFTLEDNGRIALTYVSSIDERTGLVEMIENI